MPEYTFHKLSPIDFENIVRDLLQEELDITFESFQKGKDQGIDLRHCPSTDETTIVQCKHYVDSSFSQLKSSLESEEQKIAQLQPDRYILATCKPLTPHKKREMQDAVGTDKLNLGDIYGRDDLNNLLGKFPEIEKKHFKLWLTSTPVLEKLLHSDIVVSSEHKLEKIESEMAKYVENRSFNEALDILRENHVCIISGIPGIGKTTLAQILSLFYVDKEYQFVALTSSVEEGHRMWSDGKPQMFYFDDFLGKTAFEGFSRQNEDKELVSFMRKCKESENKRFILTTREYILKKAELVSDELSNRPESQDRYILKLEQYTRNIRGKILFNHLYFSDLEKEYIQALVENKAYLEIVDHANYSPRLIETLVELPNQQDVPPDEYVSEFINNLEEPLRLWERAFDSHISDAGRSAATLLATLPNEVKFNDFRAAFWPYHQYRADRYGFSTVASAFTKAQKETEGTFLRSEMFGESRLVKFHNPSVADALEAILQKNPEFLLDICEATVFVEQPLQVLSYLHRWEEEWSSHTVEKLERSVREAIVDSFGGESSSTRKTHYRSGDKRLVKDNPTTSEQLMSILRTLDDHDPSEKDFLVEEILPKYQAALEEKDVKLHAINTIHQLDEFLDSSSQHLQRIKQLVIEGIFENAHSIHKSEGFLDVANFFERYEDMVENVLGPNWKVILAEKIEERAWDEADALMMNVDDPGILEEEAENWKRLEQILPVDLSSTIRDLRQEAMERDMHMREPDHSRPPKTTSEVSEEEVSDAELDAMFGLLTKD